MYGSHVVTANTKHPLLWERSTAWCERVIRLRNQRSEACCCANA
jgi:hypothetical protein